MYRDLRCYLIGKLVKLILGDTWLFIVALNGNVMTNLFAVEKFIGWVTCCGFLPAAANRLIKLENNAVIEIREIILK